MTKEVSEKQIAGLKAHAEERNKATLEKVHKTIDQMKKQRKAISFQSVSRETGVSRATLYKNAQLKERILSLRGNPNAHSIEKASALSADAVPVKKDRVKFLEQRIKALLAQIQQLKDDEQLLLEELVRMRLLEEENQRLKYQLNKSGM